GRPPGAARFVWRTARAELADPAATLAPGVGQPDRRDARDGDDRARTVATGGLDSGQTPLHHGTRPGPTHRGITRRVTKLCAISRYLLFFSATNHHSGATP